ncbi:DUF3043 domain-containing protein [Schaalia suimastitidis]|uniref:DUF3043 domain-containing protein n=1 Tax=Schaalia suimastitidis TaxID=121163 RepID=UPI000424248F|nr:DUF3043 domain-containing protein [Schaalia suimastitidis]
MSRKHIPTDQPDETSAAQPPLTGQKKGRPTPSRKQAEAAKLRPLVPADRKEAKRIARQKRNEAYQREQEALITGDERYLPWRDKGPVRRWVRNWIDARWSLSEFLLPVMVLFLASLMAVSLIPAMSTYAQYVIIGATVMMYGLFAVSIVEAIIVWLRLKKRLAVALPDREIPRGTWFYMYSRMIMARRWRSPRPQVARGEFPTPHAR